MTDVLILGGTGWLGPELIRSGLDRGWSVTSLTRGRGTLPPGARAVTGDRTRKDGYAAVLDRDWDVVIDTTWQPGQARSAVAALSDRTDRWILVSSNGAYADLQAPGPADDRGSLVDAFDGDHAEADQYRGAKVACEEAVLRARGDRALIARSGLLIGPGDVSDRYGYWLARFAGAGPVLVPEDQEPQLQAIDVRDLAGWLTGAAAAGHRGTLDVVGPRYQLRELLDVAAGVADFTGRAVAVADDFLAAHHVSTASGGPRTLPLWNPRAAGYPLVSAGPVLSTGIRYRSLADTARDTLADERSRGLHRTRRAGLTPDEQHALVTAARAEG